MRLAERFGPIFAIEINGERIVVLGSQALVDEVTNEQRFVKKLSRPLEMLRDLSGDGLFTAYNDEPNWALAHRLLMPAFGPLGVRDMFDGMLDVAEQMLLRWERFGPGATIDVADDMTRLTLDTIALCAFDYRFNSFYRDRLHPFVGAMVRTLAESDDRARRPPFVSRMMLRTRRRHSADLQLLHDTADAIIAGRRRQPRRDGRDDLLDHMLNGRDPDSGEGLCDDNIRYQMVTFLIAGHETTSGLLSFALHFLLKHPAIMTRARERVDAVLGDERPRVDHLARLDYIDWILKEALRLWPTAPAFALAPHVATTLGEGYRINPQDTLVVLLPTLHRDPTVWDEPEAFRPERFAPQAEAALPPNAWKPFGNGARACIGRTFALQEATLVLAAILQRFELSAVDPDYTLKVVETLTLKPEGLRIRVKRREAGRRPSRHDTPTAAAAQHSPPTADGAGTPLLVLYGSQTGSARAFAERIAEQGATRGYRSEAAALDERAGGLPCEGPVVIVSASYEGEPPDNARRFIAWLEALAPEALAGVRFTVFGVGDRQWSRTWQAIPRRLDAAMAQAGAHRLKTRGETDASGDFVGGFERWYADLWQALERGDSDRGDNGTPITEVNRLSVEVLTPEREAILGIGELHRARVVDNRELVDLSAAGARSRRHIEIALPTPLDWQAGDYLAVLPHNPGRDVQRALRRFALAADSRLAIRASDAPLPAGEHSAEEVLASYVELGQSASIEQIEQLAAATACPPERAALQALTVPATHETEVLGRRLSLLDLLERFPACALSLADFLAALPPLRMRQYSIASSPRHDPQRCALTVSVVNDEALAGGRRHHGVASSWLAGLETGMPLSVALRHAPPAFHLPQERSTPLIMIAAGSGIAPFRGFIQERALQLAAGETPGPALLFFGARHPDADDLYRDELSVWQAQGAVEVQRAFSQAPAGEIRYVQQRLWQERRRVIELLERGAIVYVCGDGQRMAPAVRTTFVTILAEAEALDTADAEARMMQFEDEEKRYRVEIFG